jgi:hypothetical protein
MLWRGHKRWFFLGIMFVLQMCALVAMSKTYKPVEEKVLIDLDVAAWFDYMRKAFKEKNWFKVRRLIEFLDSTVNPVSLAHIISGKGETLLMIAAYCDTVPTVKRVLRYIWPKDFIDYVNAHDKNGYTALDYAAFHHRMKTIEALRPYATQETMEQVEKILHDANPHTALRRLECGALMFLSGKNGISHQDPSDEDDEKIESIK